MIEACIEPAIVNIGVRLQSVVRPIGNLSETLGATLAGHPEEYKDAIMSTSVHFGRYAMDPQKRTITFKVDRASFPNWDDTTRSCTFTLEGDTLAWRTPPRPDGSIPVTILQRAKP